MKTKIALLVVCLLDLAVLSCKKNIDTNAPVNPPADHQFSIPTVSPVNGRISGIVVDETDNPVANATVVYGGISYTTDAYGFFNIENVVLDKYVSTLTVNKSGYFTGYRSFAATASRNYVSVKLIPRVLAGTINSTTGGTVSLSNGTTINFQAGSLVVKSTGAAYTGTVNVYSAYIDPTRTDFAAIVPGSMMGKDSANMFLLQSAGMLATELESGGGQPLQLAPSKTASILLPVPAALLSKAPATINTWSLNESGIWVKEGTANKNGNSYSVEVSHFSFWNTDVPITPVYATIHIHDQDGNPVSDITATLSIPNGNSYWATTSGITDSTGTVAGIVPANQGMILKLVNYYNCTTPVYTQNVGSITSDTTLNITVNLSSAQNIVVSGTATDCNAQPLQQGTATVFTAYNMYFIPVVNGAYSVSFPGCGNGNTVNIHISDSNGHFADSGPLSVTGSTVNAPALQVCAAGTEPFTFVSAQAVGVYVSGFPVNNTNSLQVIVDVHATGAWTITGQSLLGLIFSGSGTFTHTGADTVYLSVSGSDDTEGNISFPILGSNGENFEVYMHLAGAAEQADLGFEAYNYTTNGTYTPGIAMDAGNTLTYMANVATPGAYSLSTQTENGIVFQTSGSFATTGEFPVVFHAFGTPTSAAFTHYYPTGSFTSNQSFFVNVGNIANASFSFEGSPGTCTGGYSTNNFNAGSLLTESNNYDLSVNVLTTGPFSIATTTQNGFSFHYAGTFTTTGVQTIPLIGNGTPSAAGTSSFTPVGNGTIPGCQFDIIVN